MSQGLNLPSTFTSTMRMWIWYVFACSFEIEAAGPMHGVAKAAVSVSNLCDHEDCMCRCRYTRTYFVSRNGILASKVKTSC